MSEVSNKQSAIDYLIEFINNEQKDSWIKELVTCYLNDKGNISEKKLKQLSDRLFGKNNHNSILNDLKSSQNNSNLIKINRLKHCSGVNALANNQEIVFGKEATVLYGLNGSGKSSYFRILQGMIGNIPSSEIIPNIYADKPQDIEACLEYSIETVDRTISWKNAEKISDLSTVKVFDSNYANNFLGKRLTDNQIIHPYKLYVFSELTSYIDQIKEIANDYLDCREEKIVQPNTENFTDKHRTLLFKDKNKDEINLIAQNFDIEKQNQLKSIQKEIGELIQTNYEDKYKIVNNSIKEIQRIKKLIDKDLISWIKKSENYYKQCNLRKELEKHSKENIKRLEILNELPGVNSNEWKSFIQGGVALSYKIKELENKCPYCHREYDDRSIKIIKAYSVFINDRTEKQLQECEEVIDEIVSSAKNTQLFENDYICKNTGDLNKLIIQLLQIVRKYVSNLTRMKDNVEILSPITFEPKTMYEKLDVYLKKFNKELEDIKSNSLEKEKTLSIKKEIATQLISEKSIHEQIDVINKYIDDYIEIQSLREKVKAISSKKITGISAKAHKHLLTDQLVDKFSKYLKEFGILNREIELSEKNSKGKQQIELVMKSKNNVRKILSEGEQKAVSLALFLAEIDVGKNRSTVILDDPVNSLDHRMIEKLADILLEIKNQIIVFTHNRMFLDAISGSEKGHFCKNYKPNGCNKQKGRHIFVYEIKSEGINKTGVITAQIKNDAKGYLEEAKALLEQSPFSEELKVCALLRNAVDHIIDEIVFNGQTPRKYSMRGNSQNINWDQLKKMANNPEIIDNLKKVFNRVSSSQLHYGQVSTNNPTDKAELEELLNKLQSIMMWKNFDKRKT